MLAACEASQPLRHLKTILPPSFNSHASGRGASGRIAYILTAKAYRRGKLCRNIATHQELAFLPPDPPLSLIPLALGQGTRRSIILTLDDIAPYRSNQRSGTQVPSLLLEARLPSPPVLYAGDKIPLMVFLQRLSPSLEDDVPIQLQSITVNLVSTTTITVAGDRKSWILSQNLLQLTHLKKEVTNIQANDVLAELSSTGLQDIAIPNITPSFTTCTVRHEHSLELTAGLLLERQRQSKVSTVSPA